MNVGPLLWVLMYIDIRRTLERHAGVEREMTSHAYAFKHLVPPLLELCGTLWNLREVEPCWKEQSLGMESGGVSSPLLPLYVSLVCG